MKLSQLIEGAPMPLDLFGQDVEITSLSCDTRTMAAGALFVAIPGYQWQGEDFLGEALGKGAVAFVVEEKPPCDKPYILTKNARKALAYLAAVWHGHPTKKMCILGVTGTNGKTTTTYLLKAMLEKTIGAKVGLIGTTQNMIGDKCLPAVRTTPDPLELQELCARMYESGCSHVVMEVSSHALMLERVYGIEFAVGIFTNLTRDHLDFHGDMASYRSAKALLFSQSQQGVFNLDDEAGGYYSQGAACEVFTYSENKSEADLQAQNIRLFSDRVEFEALILGQIRRVKLPIPGGFTIYNALAVIAAGLCLNIPFEAVTDSLVSAKGVKGRIEVVPTKAPFTVIIDYAHTPDALEKILLTAKDFTEKRLICLFGCGGDRDRSKRSIMGAIASELSDVVVLTSDNPRTEDPETIMEEVEAGFLPTKGEIYREKDRRKAIALALSLGREGDVIVLAGKGHECYQELGTKKTHLDEREEIAAFFACHEMKEEK